MTSRHPRRQAAFALAAVTALLVAACGSSASPSPSTASAPPATSSGAPASPSGVANAPVTISVGVLRPGATQEAVDALNLQISQFEAKYPWITVQPEEYNWTAPTFTAALAAGTLPDVFTIPFTDGKGLIAQHQIVNIDKLVRAFGYADKFNPNVIVNGQDKDGAIWAVPIAAYGMSLTYNRTLFTAAGLDPDKPPTTWDEVQTAAKTIADKTGVAGYAEMATENTGGWQLTTSTYALGGRMEEVGADGKVTATLNNPQTKAALERLKAMRWTDNSMGSTFDYAWGTINQAFSAGQIGMFTGGSDLYTNMIQNNSLKPADYGVTTIPLDSSPTAGVLGGGTLAAVNVVTRDQERDAAVKWIDFYYIQKLISQDGALADAQALKANNQPVGVPALPIFDKATYDQSQTWIKDFINVPTAQMIGFTSKIFEQPIVTEPTVETQKLYAALDPVVQAVLTDKNADIDALLAAANKQVQDILNAGG
ncbi:MAG: multiple sugar transport system substrate-binding protein [Chloroflexota bacterium]|jgi:multiple sugar transport system substrate-binding protein|nr:multiple sugar transport system substrate-binding protein [Chloroflexota bacterium]